MGYFKKASKSLAYAKIALTGPSGAGKTFSALLLAKGLGGKKVGVVDTENNSASLYVDRFGDWEYYTLPVNPPYTSQKYLAAITEAEKEGIDVLIIDSLSHFWSAEGGLLQQKDALDSRGGNSFTNWNPISKLYEQVKSKILHSKMHIICTMRSKQDYVVEVTDKGKQAPRKVGLAPVMRDGMEYEFTVVFDIAMDHQFMVSKDRTGLFDGTVMTITEETGRMIKDWLAEAPPEATEAPVQQPAAEPDPFNDPEASFEEAPPAQAPKTVTQKQINRLNAIIQGGDWDKDLLMKLVASMTGKKTLSALNNAEYDLICKTVQERNPEEMNLE